MIQKLGMVLAVLMMFTLVSCGKTVTVTSDQWLLDSPGGKNAEYVKNGKVKRGEYLKVLDTKEVKEKKYYQVQVEGVDTKGWIQNSAVKDGKLSSMNVVKDSDLYMRPSLKSDKVGIAKAGQAVFVLEEKEGFTLIQYPGVEAYIQKENLGQASAVVKKISIPGLGTASVSASSQYIAGEGKELDFDPRNVFDGSLQTAWSEGKINDDGIGEYISLAFDQYVHLSSISIVNGFTKSEELYQQNGRVAQLKVVADNGAETYIDLEDNIMDYQKKDIDISGNSFRFIINKVYKGRDSDTCIAEIKLEGEPATPPQQHAYED